MIRIDEIYYNVFLQAMQHRTRVGLHWFDPFGSVRYEDICNLPPVHGTANQRIVFWDQEPLYEHTATEFFDQFCANYLANDTILVTSEKNSKDAQHICQRYNLRSCDYFFHGWAALDWYRGYNHSYLGKPWLQRSFSHRWICPNNIVSGNRSHRLELLHEFIQRDLISHGMISFPERCPFSGEPVTDLMRQRGWDTPITLPLVIDDQRNHANHSHRIDFWDQAMQSFCQIVTETVYASDRLHLTEKTFKPIVLQQPFILVGPRHSLRYLRDYGFRTFDCLWSENYDNMDDQARMSAIAEICQDLASWSPATLREAQVLAWENIKHNHDWFYGGFQDRLWNELTEMIDQW